MYKEQGRREQSYEISGQALRGWSQEKIKKRYTFTAVCYG